MWPRFHEPASISQRGSNVVWSFHMIRESFAIFLISGKTGGGGGCLLIS